MKRTITLLCASVFLGVCPSQARLDPIATPDERQESVIVLGASDGYEYFLFPGKIRDQRFHQDAFRSASVAALPDRGFIVARARAGDTLSVLRISARDMGAALSGHTFAPSGDTKLYTLEVPRDRVVYYGDLKVSPGSKGLSLSPSWKFDQARAHIDAHYPALKGRLEAGSSRWVRAPEAPSVAQRFIHY